MGYDYSTNETVNLIGAEYSGPGANPEYIRILNPNGINYSLEIVGVDLAYPQNTTVAYMNTEERNATVGVLNQINMTKYFDPGESGNLTAVIPLMDSSRNDSVRPAFGTPPQA